MAVYREALVSIASRYATGAVVHATTEDSIRKHWCQFFCQFPSDKPVNNQVGTIRVPRDYWRDSLVTRTRMLTAQQWDDVVSIWSVGLLSDWIDAESAGLAVAFWNSVMEPVHGLRDILGLDARGDISMVDAWPWGSGEKTAFYPFTVTASDSEIADAAGRDEKGLPLRSLDINSLSMSSISRTEILSPTTLVEPRRNLPLDKSLFGV